MGAFVLLCSPTLPWVFADEASPAADALLDQLVQDERVWVPALWHLELGNVPLGAKRRNRIDQAGIETPNTLSHPFGLTNAAVADIIKPFISAKSGRTNRRST